MVRRTTKDKVALQRLESLKAATASSRKLLRLGKPLEHAATALRSRHIEDEVLRFTSMLKSLALAVYLSYDMLGWLSTTRIYVFTRKAHYARRAAQFWLVALCFSWLNSVYRLRQLRLREAVCERISDAAIVKSVHVVEAEKRSLTKERATVQRQLLQDTLDAMIPANALKIIDIGEGVVGLAGMVTSIMGIRAQWNKV